VFETVVNAIHRAAPAAAIAFNTGPKTAPTLPRDGCLTTESKNLLGRRLGSLTRHEARRLKRSFTQALNAISVCPEVGTRSLISCPHCGAQTPIYDNLLCGNVRSGF
jgi:hypothetical protein